MRKQKIALLVVMLIIVVSLAGCAALKSAMTGVTPEQNAATTAQVAEATAPYIPEPYQIPASITLGYLAAVAYNWFKAKTTKS